MPCPHLRGYARVRARAEHGDPSIHPSFFLVARSWLPSSRRAQTRLEDQHPFDPESIVCCGFWHSGRKFEEYIGNVATVGSKRSQRSAYLDYDSLGLLQSANSRFQEACPPQAKVGSHLDLHGSYTIAHQRPKWRPIWTRLVPKLPHPIYK